MEEYKQTESELKSQLKEQIEFLGRSSKSFDEGSTAEGKRLALHIRVLLHDTKRSRSLLKQLGTKDILFYDTSIDYDPKNLAPTMGLVMTKLGPSGVGYVPPLDNGPPSRYVKGKVTFDKWWNKIVWADIGGNTLTREKLILSVCDKDGGAHVDANLDKAYAEMTRLKSHALVFYANGKKTESATPAELASVRQIAHEVLKSLKDAFSELF